MRINTIDTRHGTDNQYSFSNGNCLPYTGVPFGLNFFAPQTTSEKGSRWFNPNDRTFQGFRLTHQPSPWMGDFSYFTMLPIQGELAGNSLFHAQSSYRPSESLFNPAQLDITSLRYHIRSKLVPSLYGAMLQLSNLSGNAGLALSLPGNYRLTQRDQLSVVGEIINYSGCEDENFTFYFILEFETPIRKVEGELDGKDGFVIIRFEEAPTQTVRLGTSFISTEQAILNFEREKNLTFEERLHNAQSEWDHYLNKINVEHHNQDQVNTFYHNLYRTFLFPQTFYEINAEGEKVHYDTLSKTVKKGVLYTNNGFWDTYKTVYPLYSLIAVEKYEEMLEGFLNSYRNSGFLPKWLSPDERGLMPGTLIDAVIADAATKNIRPDLMPELLEAMKKSATIQSENTNYGRSGTYDYLKYGYVPNTYHESVNHTLDYCYSDFCISKVAERLGRPDDVSYYANQAKNYQNIYDSETGFMRSKNTEGQFRKPFDKNAWGRDYAEGSAWQSSFAVFHDFDGLINIRGQEAFTQQLIELCNQKPTANPLGYGFEIHEMSEMLAIEFGQIAISNQPSFHLPYLFSYLGKPEMAQPLLKNLLTECFNASPTGFPGDEDNGSMAGWYIFNSLGFYPVCPGSGEYVIGMPLFDRVSVSLSNGETLTIESSPNYPQQQFIHETKVNGEVYPNTFLKHEDVLEGMTINFQLGIVPNAKNYTPAELPFSLSKDA
ncbi:GH92 family glycosyl hydrolase [Vagococcus zengguangii]|uniref:Alpha-mannosidase n=1 Tax=Vagococcus zengguangii TaxID=2571750 RepID=A0A4D7CQ67_9ENTE|nr:GH92 family glycosyl hydrolase [Vagococcus zengguangii]QCI86209.1 alpha-mannosidase [Vagococcus zengguangii]